MLSTHRVPSLSFILYIHDLIDSLLFEILYANEETKTQRILKNSLHDWDLDLSVFDSKVIIMYCISLVSPHNHILCSQTELLSVPFMSYNFRVHFCFFRNAFLPCSD